ncbi:hypothetical protein [Saccharopolyspora sp. NPDC002376]
MQPDFPADLLAGRVDESIVNPRRSGIRMLDNLTELTYYSVQMRRMAAGKEPAPNRHAAINLAQYLLNNGFESLRMPRRGH